MHVYLPGGERIRFNELTAGGYGPTDPGNFDELTKAGGQYTLHRPDGTEYRFDTLGRLREIADRNDNRLQLIWDASSEDGRLVTVIDTVGRQIDFEYLSAGSPRLQRIVLPDGRFVEYEQSFGRLSKAWELDSDGPNGRNTTYTYSGEMVSSISRKLGSATMTSVMNTYDSSTGRLETQQDAVSTTSYAYGPGVTTVSKSGHEWVHTYTGDGLLLSTTDPNGNETSITTYDAATLQPTTVVRPGGQTWVYTYNAFGAVLSVEPPIAAAEVTYRYENPDFPTLPTFLKDGNGNVTRWVYDATGHLLCEILPTSTVATGTWLDQCSDESSQTKKITYTYDADHLLDTITDPKNHTTDYDYFGQTAADEKAGQLQSVTTPEGLTTSYDYNSFGQQATMVTPQSGTWSYDLDDAGRVETVTDPLTTHPLGFTTSYAYDAEGNVILETDAVGHETSHGYLPGGIECFVSRGSGGSCGSPPTGATSYTYDADGNLETVTDGNDQTTTYAYHDNGELASVTDPLVRVWAHSPITYTSTSSQMTTTINSGAAITRTYDTMGHLTTVDYPATVTGTGLDPAPDESYTYDDNGNMLSAGSMSFTYDAFDRMLTAGGFTYSYDNAGNLTSREYPNGKDISYAYEDDDRLCAINLSATAPTCTNGAIEFAFSLETTPATVTRTFSNGETVTTLDKAGRTTKIVNRYGSGLTQLSVFDPTLDAAGFPETIDVTNNGLASGLTTETQTFAFDDAARLTRVCYNGATSATCGSGSGLRGYSFDYDDAGNIDLRTTYNGSSTTSTDYTYDAANQLATAGSATYSYTANGDLQTDGTTTYRYDVAHRMTKAAITGTFTDNFAYDALGNRASKTPGSGTATTYEWDPNAPVAQLATETTGSTVMDLFYGAGLQAMKKGGATYYFDRDQTDSVANLVKSNGTLTYSYSYRPYGGFRSNRKNDSSVATDFNPMVFDAEYRDTATNGLTNLRARMYDPGTGAFMQPDPIGSFPDYTFASGNPAMFSDPTGLFSLYGPVDLYNDWMAGPTWSKVVAGAAVIIPAVALLTACALTTVGICAGFTVFGLGSTAASGTTACAEFCDDALAISDDFATVASRSLPYAQHVVQRAAQDPRFHDFPRYLDGVIIRQGAFLQRSSTYAEWRFPGFLNGSKGVYEIGVDLARYDVPTITHRFFRPGA